MAGRGKNEINRSFYMVFRWAPPSLSLKKANADAGSTRIFVKGSLFLDATSISMSASTSRLDERRRERSVEGGFWRDGFFAAIGEEHKIKEIKKKNRKEKMEGKMVRS